MSIVTVYNGLFSNATTVVRQLIEKTGYQLVTDQDIVSEAVKLSGMSEEKLVRAFQEKTSVFNKFSHEKERAVAWLRLAMAHKLLDADKVVFAGFISHLPSCNISHVLRVCLIAEMKDRIARAENLEGLAEKYASKLIHKDNEDRQAWVKMLRGEEDPWSGKLYDMVIPVSKMSTEEAVELISEHINSVAVTVTAESRAAVEDFVLAAKVETVLTNAGHTVSVSAHNKEVTLTINKHVLMLERLESEIAEIAGGVEGVEKVVTKVGKDFHQSDIYRKADFEAPSKVLLVDDEREFVQSLSERLNLRDVGSTVVFDGESALNMLQDDEPEVMILDQKMPGIDGIEVLRRVKESNPAIEVIILTGHGSEEDRDTCMKLGAFAYLHKPVEFNVLSDTLKAAYEKIHKNTK